MAGRCQFHSSGAGYLHDVHQVEVRAGAHSLSDPRPVSWGHGPVLAPVSLLSLTTYPARSGASAVTFTLDSQ